MGMIVTSVTASWVAASGGLATGGVSLVLNDRPEVVSTYSMAAAGGTGVGMWHRTAV